MLCDIRLQKKTFKNAWNAFIHIPAPVSLARTCSDIVSLEDLLADLNEEYKTQHIHIIKLTMLWLSNLDVDELNGPELQDLSRT